EARKELASILDAHPDFARAWLVLGSYYVQEARYVEALAAFDRTLSLAPDRPVAHLRRGLALERLQRTEEARQAYAQAAKLDPDGVEAHLAVARTSLSLGDAAAAIAAVEQIPRSSWTAATFRYLGKARLLLGDFARSVEALRAAVTRDPEDRQAWVALAQALQRRGEPGAADALQRAQELSRNEPVVKQSRLAEGIAEHGKILLMQARVLINEGRAEEALATLDEALAYRPGDAAEITRLRSRARDLIDPEVGPFVDVASTLGLTAVNVSGRTEKRFILETTGSGAAWVDYDRDGRLDVMLANGNAARYMPLANGGSAIEPTGRSVDSLLRQGADGNFHDIARAAGVADPGWAGGVAVGDVDNDGWPDLYLTHYGANRLYRNNGDGTFTDITLAAHADDPRWSTSAAFADFDADGFLDLYIANYVVFDTAAPFLDGKQQCTFMGVPGFCGPSGMEGASDSLFWNDGALGFEPSSQGVVRDTAFYGLGVMPLHADDDGRIDLYVANDATPNLLFLNKGKRELEEDGLLYGVAYSGDGQEQAGMGIAAGDYDADGDDDIVVTNFSNDVDTLYRNIQPPPFRDATQAVGLALPTLAYLGWGTSLRDFDLDGDLDLFIANGHVYPQVDGRDIGTTYAQRNQIFANVVGRFVDIGKAAGTGMESVKSSRSTVIADYDGDGDEDILVTNIDDRPTLLRNDQARGNRWLQVHLVGRRSNRDGNDAQVTLISAAGSLTRTVETAAGYLGSSDPTLTFGLGDQLDGNLEVRWPSGAVERIERVPSGCLNLIVEGRGVVARRCS
ncbi:MAG: FG-GAP-like repeat-containing protein, partial [Acidobacteriota bacterium]